MLNSATSDESALHTLALALKPLNKLDALPAAYELSLSKHPGSLELLRGLFGQAVRWALRCLACAATPHRHACWCRPQLHMAALFTSWSWLCVCLMCWHWARHCHA